jgi:UPF0716 protein FxsA
MAFALALLFLALPIAELALIVTVARGIGVLDTLALLVVVSIVGAWLAKREGLGVYQRIRAALQRGEMPNREIADGFLILLAGALMISPGFITDILALVLLFPPTRAVARRVLLGVMARRAQVAVLSSAGSRGFGPAGRGRRGGDVWDVDSWEDPPADGPSRGRRRSGELEGPS